MSIAGLDRASTADDWQDTSPADFGDDLLYAAESVHQEALAVIRNLYRAKPDEQRKAYKFLCDARALINEAITECQP